MHRLTYGIGVADVFVDMFIGLAFGPTALLADGVVAFDEFDLSIACVETRLLFTVLLLYTVGFGIGALSVEGIPLVLALLFAVAVFKLLLLLLDVRP